MITAAQIRAARALLRWSAEELAKQSRVSLPTIQRMESADGVPSSHKRNLEAVRRTLATGGIIFIDGGENELVGVMFKEKGN